MKWSIVYNFSLFFLLQSCQSNEFYFDMKLQRISSANKKGIMRLYIENDSTDEKYRIEWKNIKKKPPIEINIYEIPNDYEITRGWERQKITILKLNPNSKYKIRRSQGDASAFQIEINTNNQGIIVSTKQSTLD